MLEFGSNLIVTSIQDIEFGAKKLKLNCYHNENNEKGNIYKDIMRFDCERYQAYVLSERLMD